MSMSRGIYIVAFISMLLVAGCTKKDDNLVGIENQLSVSELKVRLLTAKDNNNPIVELREANNLYELGFEDGTSVGVNSDYIEDMVVDSLNWIVTFQLSDGSTTSGYIIGKMDVTSDMVVVDPYSRSPLTALAKFEMPIKGKFKVIVHGKGQAGISIEKDFLNYGNSHELPVLGLYPDYQNQVEFIFTSQTGIARWSKTLTLSTNPLAVEPTIVINKNSLSKQYQGLYLVADLRLAFDQMGEIRWAYTGDASQFYHKLVNGNVSIASSDYSSFDEVTVLGRIIKKYNVPNSLHHEIQEMPSGNFLIGSNSNNGTSVEDIVVEISRASGSVVKTWDFNKLLDPTRPPLPIGSVNDWLHLNCVYFDATDNSIVISSRHQSAVVKFDYLTGQVKWILGNHAYWNTGFSPYLLTPIDSTGSTIDASLSDFWQYGQHAPERLASGNILLYDDGNYRGYYDNPNVAAQSYTRAVEYKIDEQNKTVQLVWKFDNNKSIFTGATGYVDQLTQSNTRMVAYMFGSPNTPKIVEIDKENNVLFDVNVNTGSSYYRALKVDLYESVEED